MHQPPTYFPLDYYRVSPVRGHLEAYDPASPKSWRYIQTTDTPNELKVLLPPAISSQYDQLLRIELAELANRPCVSWERILEIRHLKERMLRKCQRLSRIIPPKRLSRGEPFVFQTLMAPEDFRLKEMEAWFQQEVRNNRDINPTPSTSTLKPRPPTERTLVPKGATRNNACCTRCRAAPLADSGHTRSHERSVDANPPTPPRSPPGTSHASRPHAPSHSPAPQDFPEPHPPELQHLESPPRQEQPLPDLVLSSPEPESPDAGVEESKLSPDENLGGVSSSDSSTGAPTPPPSPPPLPHLLRISDPSLMKHIEHAELPSESSDEAEAEPSPPSSNPTTVRPSPIPVQHPMLSRRRSCIKRSSGDSGKTVSWADDHNVSEQIAKIAFFTNEPSVDEADTPEHVEENHNRAEEKENGSDSEDDTEARLESLRLELKKGLEEAQADPAHFELIESLISDHKQKMRNGLPHDSFHLKSTLLDHVLEVDDEDSKMGDSDWDS